MAKFADLVLSRRTGGAGGFSHSSDILLVKWLPSLSWDQSQLYTRVKCSKHCQRHCPRSQPHFSPLPSLSSLGPVDNEHSLGHWSLGWSKTDTTNNWSSNYWIHNKKTEKTLDHKKTEITNSVHSNSGVIKSNCAQYYLKPYLAFIILTVQFSVSNLQ